MTQFKKGDRVRSKGFQTGDLPYFSGWHEKYGHYTFIVIGDNNYSGNLPGLKLQALDFVKGHDFETDDAFGNYEHNLVLEEVYNSPLWRALNEV